MNCVKIKTKPKKKNLDHLSLDFHEERKVLIHGREIPLVLPDSLYMIQNI